MLPSAEQAELLALAATEERVDFSLAAVVVVERMLIEEDLRLAGHGPALTILDGAASATRVMVELSEPTSAYLRALEGGSAAASRVRDSVRLPMRLTERVGARTLERLLDARMLRSALAWERAAVLSGRTMSEWAALAIAALEAV
jgi:hypothetical protein